MYIPDRHPTQFHKSRHADENQKVVWSYMRSGTYLYDERRMDRFLLWNTYLRRNLHRVAIDYLGIQLYIYQIIILYLMGISRFFVIIASRSAAKSFIIALYACCRAIVRPGSMIVLASATRGQSKLIISEKIKNELMAKSPMLRREIRTIKDNQTETIIFFKNTSTITVVTANDNARGHRSTCLIREEFRTMDKNVDDSVLAPFQILRQPPFIMKAEYAENTDLLREEESCDIYISSSWFDPNHWMWQIADQASDIMLNSDSEDSYLLAFDESITLKHNIKSMTFMKNEKRKQDPLTWKVEFLNMRIHENKSSFFTYKMLAQNQRCKQPFYPRTNEDVKAKKKNPYDIPKQPGEIRLISCDMAFVENKNNDNSVFSFIRLLPESTTYKTDESGETVISNGYRRIVPYMESHQGGEIKKQAVRIEQLFYDTRSDYIVLDLRNAGRNAA